MLILCFLAGFVAGAFSLMILSYFIERRYRRRLAEIDRIGRALIEATSMSFAFALDGNPALSRKWAEESERLKKELAAA